jgi:hypothetical protein
MTAIVGSPPQCFINVLTVQFQLVSRPRRRNVGELGLIDCGHSGRSDRYVDLAVIEAELLTEFGRDAAECFNYA